MVAAPDSTALRVVHITPSLAPAAGGTARSISRLTEHLSRCEAGVHLLTLTSPNDRGLLLPDADVNTLTATCRLHLGGYPLWIPEFTRALDTLIHRQALHLIHDHGCWLPTNHAAWRAARRHRLPLIISPRGMLEPWSLQQSRVRKTAAWHLFQARALQRANVLHATAASEAANLRRLGLRQPIVVIPNGTDLPPQSIVRPPRTPDSQRTLLFLSRIHPKKGLLNLVAALPRALPANWRVLIAGPDENNHQAAVQTAVRAASLQDRVTFVGPVDHQAKWDLYAQADLFVLPTFSENFGNVVVEALAAGVPVITTKGAPWQELDTHRCGWWIDIGIEPLAQALQVAMQLPDAARQSMGERGRALVHARYTWQQAAAQMIQVYRWLVDQAPAPDTLYQEGD